MKDNHEVPLDLQVSWIFKLQSVLAKRLRGGLHGGSLRHANFHQTFKSPVFYWLEMVRPGGFELPTFWFVAVRSTLPNLARGVANRTKSASWGQFSQTAFSFICCRLPHFCRCFLQFALHFRDSIAIQVERAKELVR